MNQMTLIHPLTNCFLKVYVDVILTSMPSITKWSLPFRIPRKQVYAFLFSSTRATCSAHFSFIDITALIMFVKVYKP